MDYNSWIDGEWRDSQGGKKMAIENPATGETIAQVIDGSREDVDRAEAENTGKLYEFGALGADLPFAIDNLRFFAAAARDVHVEADSEMGPLISHVMIANA